MNIAFDSTAILGPMSKNRGIGNYALSQFITMINLDKENNYFFINLFEDFKLSEFISECDNFEESYLYCGRDNFLLKEPNYENVIGDIIKNYIKKNNIDVFYITSPFESSYPLYKKEWFGNIKVVATVYDIIPYVFKDKYLTDKNTYSWYMSCIEILNWVDKCLVISKSVKDDMVKFLGFDESKISVIYGAVDNRFKKIVINENKKKEILSKFGIENRFVMCTGGDDERKNINELIIAYSRIGQDLINSYQLVIVCKLSIDSMNKYLNVINNNKLSGRVILTNFVTNDELIILYNLAHLMAFPSKYEGFGLPVVEAFACGVPVLTSNNSSLGEIAEDAAVLIDPYNTKDITRGLIESLTRIDLNELIMKGFEKLKLYQWEKVAALAIEQINSMGVINASTFQKKKIAFFTPLPPIKSGISDYSVDILNAMSEYFEIDVYIDDGYNPKCQLNYGINIYNHKQFIKNNNKYYETIYQIGNSEFHAYMWGYIKKYKGTIVLHDYNLHACIQHHALYLGENDIKLYKSFLLEDFDEEVIEEYIADLINGSSNIRINEMELNGFAVNYAKKIIVHSIEAREKLLKKDIHRNIKTINHYAKIEPLVDINEVKSKMNVDVKTIVMASFGHIQETKRAIPILKAFNRLYKDHDNVKYYFVGKLDDSIKLEFESFIKENSLQNKVIVTGYTELDEFVNYIDLTDICFNLRYPYNGETSGSLMRILAKGKCVVVNDIGSFSEIPDSCCIKLPSADKMSEESEVNMIYNVMEEIMFNNKRNIVSKNARNFAETNLDLNKISEKYVDFINEMNVPHLNEAIILKILNDEIVPLKYSKQEILKLSRTLGFSKNVNNDITIKNEVNIENIMAQIRKDIKFRGAQVL